MQFKVKPLAALAACFAMFLSAGAPGAVNTIKLSADVNTSFSGTFLSYVLTPRKSSDKFNPMTVRMYPASFNLLSGGINFKDIQYNKDYFQLTVYRGKTPLIQVIAVRNTSAEKLKSSMINSEFTGSLISAQNVPETSDEALFENITNECSVDNKLKTKKIGSSVFGYLDCGSRSTHLFYSRLAPDALLAQPYESPFKGAGASENASNEAKSGDDDGGNGENDGNEGKSGESAPEKPQTRQENIVLVHVLSENEIDYRQPFNTITVRGLPVNSVNRFLQADFPKLSPDDQRAALREAVLRDVSFTHAVNEDNIVKKLTDPAYTVKEMRKMPLSGISSAMHKNNLSIRNRAENYFSNNITVFADSPDSNIHTIAVAAAATPMILSTSDIDTLADEIARDPLCRSPSGVNTLQLTNEDAMEIDCEVPFSTRALPRHYYLISQAGRSSGGKKDSKKGGKNAPSYEQVQIIMLAGNTSNHEMDDVVNSLHLSENYRWHLSLNNPTEQDLDLLFTIPRVKKWYEIFVNTDEDDQVDTAWYRFAREGSAIYAQNMKSSPEVILRLLNANAAVIAKDFPEEPEKSE